MSPEEARQALVDAAAWHSFDNSDASELTMAAAQALVVGLDSESLRELAGVPARAPWGELSSVASRAFEDLGLRFPEWQSDQGKRDALRHLARR
jgi:acid phosphatase family membrane protein YuiD